MTPSRQGRGQGFGAVQRSQGHGHGRLRNRGLAIASLCWALHGGEAAAATPTSAPTLASTTPTAPGPPSSPDGAPAASRPPPATPIIPVREVRAGMTGYGLTVFKGTHPERFAVRVIGVLRNFLPQLDLILIDSDDPRLLHSGIAAGMSGSPIFIEGKLAGALAYGWQFGKDPVAGVTPIERMLSDMRRPLRAQPAAPLAAAGGPAGGAADWPPSGGAGGEGAARERFVAPLPRRELLRALAGGEAPAASPDRSLNRLTPASLLPEPRLVRASVPLSVAGLSEQALDGLREALSSYQVRPLQAGGAGVANAKGPERFEPGGSLGVQLIRGDISATGVGTVTYVDGEKVMGFGHPMLGDGGAGEVLFPIATAEVVTILSSLSSSFKMATPLSTLGSLLLDRETGVVGEAHKQAPMVPVQVTVQIPGQSDRVFSTEVASHRFLTPLLAASVASSSIQSAAPDVSDVTVRVQSRLGLRGFAPLQQTDTLYSPGGVTPRLLQSSSGMRHLPELLFNPFGPTRVERLDLTVAVEYKSEVAEIIGLSLVSDELEPDTRPSLYVTLRPYSGASQVRAVPFEVPRGLAGQMLKIEASAGNLVKPEIAPPESLTDLVDNLRKGYAARQLVVTLTTTEEGVSHRGRLIPSLPASVIATLRPGSTTRRGEVYKRLTRFAVDVGTVLVGTKELTVQVKDDPR